MPNGTMDVSLQNTRLLAGIAAVLIAWFTKNTLITILAGMVLLFLFNFLR
jgi:branched-subunit amino acid transport protein